MKAGELRFLGYCVTQEVHHDGSFTSAGYPRKHAESLAEAGLLERIQLVLSDGDGYTLEPERERTGYKLTMLGIRALVCADSEDLCESLSSQQLDSEKRTQWLAWTAGDVP